MGDDYWFGRDLNRYFHIQLGADNRVCNLTVDLQRITESEFRAIMDKATSLLEEDSTTTLDQFVSEMKAFNGVKVRKEERCQ
jgi:hypothetical protein